MMEYKEEDFLMLSGIQHYSFCKRQWALIHIEQQWKDNEYTVEGELMHKKAHDGFLSEKRKDLLISRGLPVFSRSMGIHGVCDIVEFEKAEDGISLYGHRGLYKVYPIEYKKGRPKDTEIDIMQLAAQAMCLEEMFSTVIEKGAVFYGETRRREEVILEEGLKGRVREAFQEMRRLFERRYTPKVKWSKSCNACSLRDVCLPKLGKKESVGSYIGKRIREE